MKIKLWKYLLALLVIASLTASIKAHAKISFLAFKNVTQYFKKDKEFYSPTLGEIALESGLIHNLRLYGNFDVQDNQEGKREYILDGGKDALSQVVKTLFPSPAGQIATETQAKDNFGQYVKNPESVALLLNFSKDYRVYLQQQAEMKIKKEEVKAQTQPLRDQLKLVQTQINEIKEALAKQKGMPSADPSLSSSLSEKHTQNMNLINQIKKEEASIVQEEKNLQAAFLGKKKAVQEKLFITLNLPEEVKKIYKTHEYLLSHIEKSILQEKDSFYPLYTTEQVISAFFCEKFNSQGDIWTLLKYLDEDIIDKTQPFPEQEDYLKKDDIFLINTKSQHNIDDTLSLINMVELDSPIPYKPGQDALSNGSTNPYERLNNKIQPSRTFADCAEIAARHIMNLLLYDQDKKEFNLDYIKKYVSEKSPQNPYFDNFIRFYEQQLPIMANAGDLKTRSLWNTVVGDLNAFNDSSKKILYVHDTYELEPGLVNFITVFEKIFGLTFAPFPEKENIDVKRKWLQESLNLLFQTVNPQKAYKMDLSKLEEKENDLSGTILIAVSDPQINKELFTFKFYSRFKVHAEIKELKSLWTTGPSGIDSSKIFIHKDTAEEAIWLLVNNNKRELLPLYAIFPQALMDNDSKIRTLKTMSDKYEEWTNRFPNLISMKQVIGTNMKNILQEIGWQDYVVVNNISPILMLLTRYPDFLEILANSVKKAVLRINTISMSDFSKIDTFKNLENLSLNGNNSNITDISLQPFSKLKTFSLKDSNIKKINIPVDLVNLEAINLENTQNLEELSLSSLQNIKMLSIRKAGIKKINLEGEFPKLEEINLSDAMQISELNLPSLPNLKTLNLGSSGVKKINGFERLPNLEKLYLSKIYNIEENPLPPLPNLMTLSLQDSPLQKINGLEAFPKLKQLMVGGNKNMVEISLNAPNLEYLELGNSNIREINGLETLSQLKILNLMYLPFKKDLIRVGNVFRAIPVKNINLNDVFINLTIILGNGSIYEGLSAHNLPALKSMDIRNSIIYEELSLHNLPMLQSFSLEGIQAKKVRLDALVLEKLITGGSGDIQELFLNNLSKLTSLSLNNTKVKKLYLENMDALQDLSANSLPQLEQVAFTGSFQNLKKISFEGSGIKSVTGLENLPNLEEVNIKGTTLKITSQKFKVIQ